MQALQITESHITPTLRQTLFRDRGSQFVDRHGWDLCVRPDGMEIDQYDNADSTYLVVQGHGEGHLGSCRIRPFTAPTMLFDHFADVFPGARAMIAQQPHRLYELTRFCRAPHLSVADGQAALRVLAKQLDDLRDARNAAGFVAVVFPGVARYLRSVGVRFLVLDQGKIDGKRAQLICVTHAVSADCARKAAPLRLVG